MKGTIKVLDGSGHTTLPYDTDTGKGVKEAEKALGAAGHSCAQVFDTAQKPGVKMVGPTLGSTTEMTVVPAFQGG